MLPPDLIGIVAAVITTLCWLPQVVRLIRTKETAAISLFSYRIFALGILLWLVYGMMIRSIPVVASNIATFILLMVIIILKLRYEKLENAKAQD